MPVSCSICINDINVESSFATDPCNHVFHRECIQIWLNDNDSCPNCRIQINRHTSCSILNNLRETRLTETRRILELQDEVHCLYERVRYLETLSIVNIPWYSDTLLGIIYAILPRDIMSTQDEPSSQ